MVGFNQLLCVVVAALSTVVAAAPGDKKGPKQPKPKPPQPLKLAVSTKGPGRNKTAPLLHGLFFEDINHSGDGGLYAELIRNRAFQGSDSNAKPIPYQPTLEGYKPIGGAKLSLNPFHPLSNALKIVMQVDIPADATGEVGFLNEGWWGIDVKPHNYDASFYIKPSEPRYNGALTTGVKVSLRSAHNNKIWAEESVSFNGNLSTTKYTQFQTVLTPKESSPDANNVFAITFDGKKAAGQTFYFSFISLFPPTYKGRKNGLRKDLAQLLKDNDPKFLRFPGGNNLEGISIDTRWKWKENIGPLIDRPGRVGNWGYYNTDGLGYLEYLLWCEDLELEPLLTVYAGYSLDASGINPANTVAEDELDFYIQEALDQLEYAMGGPETKWGALRAKHGHPEPFSIKYVEIGNEDWFSKSYHWRYPRFLKALQAKYPNIKYIASQALEKQYPDAQNITIPPGGMWDLHHYQTPQFYKDNFNYFDNWNEVYNYPGVEIFVGEFSVLSRDRPGGVDWVNGEGRFQYPPMIAAVGEAIFALAMERNPKVVTLSSYAPLLQHFNGTQWTPNFIAFSADPKQTVLSTSYWLTQLLSKFHGEYSIPIINKNGDFNPIWWQAASAKGNKSVYVKLVNSEAEEAKVEVEFDANVRSANATVLTHEDPYAFNFIGNGTIVPRSAGQQKVKGKKVEYKLPGYSVNILEVRLK